MIDHIVLVKFADTTPTEQLQEVVNRFKALKPHLSGVVDLQAGINFSPVEKSKGYQVILKVRFEDKAALEAYGPHSKHQELVTFINGSGRLDSIVVDIEI